MGLDRPLQGEQTQQREDELRLGEEPVPALEIEQLDGERREAEIARHHTRVPRHEIGYGLAELTGVGVGVGATYRRKQDVRTRLAVSPDHSGEESREFRGGHVAHLEGET